jgi:hypothetical protein
MGGMDCAIKDYETTLPVITLKPTLFCNNDNPNNDNLAIYERTTTTTNNNTMNPSTRLSSGQQQQPNPHHFDIKAASERLRPLLQKSVPFRNSNTSSIATTDLSDTEQSDYFAQVRETTLLSANMAQSAESIPLGAYHPDT